MGKIESSGVYILKVKAILKEKSQFTNGNTIEILQDILKKQIHNFIDNHSLDYVNDIYVNIEQLEKVKDKLFLDKTENKIVYIERTAKKSE